MYKGYKQTDLNSLLVLLATLKGKFILTYYPNTALKQAIQANNRHKVEIERTISTNLYHRKKQKERLVANYDLQTTYEANMNQARVDKQPTGSFNRPVTFEGPQQRLIEPSADGGQTPAHTQAAEQLASK